MKYVINITLALLFAVCTEGMAQNKQELKGMLDAVQMDNALLQDSIQQLQDSIWQLRSEIKIAKRELALCEQHKAEIVSMLKNTSDETSDAVSENWTFITGLDEELRQMETHLEKLLKRKTPLKQMQTLLSKEITALYKRFQDTNSEIEKLSLTEHEKDYYRAITRRFDIILKFLDLL